MSYDPNAGKFMHLSLKAPVTTAADDIHKYFHCFSEKIKLDVSSESSARQRIHVKNQALFSSKDKSKKIKMPSAAIFVWRFKGKVSGYTFRRNNLFYHPFSWSILEGKQN